jgi:hypothetical protein
MVRSGCSTCHAALEPMSAFFTRVSESNWTYLPPANFPLANPTCAGAAALSNASCRAFYDPDFATAARGLMRGAYGSMANADAGPAGLARQLTAAPEFAGCVAQNIAQSFLGRDLDSDDGELLTQLTQAFTAGGYRMRALVRTMVLSDAYHHANNLSSAAWRAAGGSR